MQTAGFSQPDTNNTSGQPSSVGGFGGAALGGAGNDPMSGGNGGFGATVTPTPTRPPSFPTAQPAHPTEPTVSPGPLPPGVGLINYSPPIYNRDTGGIISVPGWGSGFTSGLANAIWSI
jgi:hypothetical protein